MTDKEKKTRKPRSAPRPMNDFGKEVNHYMINKGLTIANIEDAASIKSGGVRKYFLGEEKLPPLLWVSNRKLPVFIREAAAVAHRDGIIAAYDSMVELLGPVDTPKPALVDTGD